MSAWPGHCLPGCLAALSWRESSRPACLPSFHSAATRCWAPRRLQASWTMGVLDAPSNRGLKPSKFEMYNVTHFYQVPEDPIGTVRTATLCCAVPAALCDVLHTPPCRAAQPCSAVFFHCMVPTAADQGVPCLLARPPAVHLVPWLRPRRLCWVALRSRRVPRVPGLARGGGAHQTGRAAVGGSAAGPACRPASSCCCAQHHPASHPFTFPCLAALQALARGYAVLAVESKNRERKERCFNYSPDETISDAYQVPKIIEVSPSLLLQWQQSCPDDAAAPRTIHPLMYTSPCNCLRSHLPKYCCCTAALRQGQAAAGQAHLHCGRLLWGFLCSEDSKGVLLL